MIRLIQRIAPLTVLLGSMALGQDYWPTLGWRSTTPEEQGFDSVKLAEGLQAVQSKGLKLHSLLVIGNGQVLLDAYLYPYDDPIPHKLASVTKSITTLMGIAVGQGKLKLDDPVLSFFPGRTIANLDSRKEHITVRHLAGMVNGFLSGCLSGDEPTLQTMRSNPDWVQAALDRVMVQEPGSGFCYDSPGMHLLSAILQKATGMSELEFARSYLFAPLGIREVFGPNAAEVATLRLDFSDTTKATLQILYRQGNQEFWTIGLDGKYRSLADGRALRGYWADPQTIVLQIFEEGVINYRLHFEGNRVEISSPQLGQEFEGQVQNP